MSADISCAVNSAPQQEATMELTDTLPFMGGLFLLGAVCGLMVVLIRSGSLERNSLFGIKTKHTLASDEAWDAGHHASLPVLRWLIWGGSGALAAAVVLCVVGALQFAFVVTACGYVWVLAWLVVATKWANDAAKRQLFLSDE